MKRFAYEELPQADLVIGATYCQGDTKDIRSEPLHRLLPGVGNQGGFRAARGPSGNPSYVVLYTSGEDADWPDTLDEETGLLNYFGDNKSPGTELHETSRGGNRVLREAYSALHGDPEDRIRIPPFFLFRRGAQGREATFLGLAVPGSVESVFGTDLVAIWRTTNGERFQNYRALFSILDTGSTIPREWIHELAAGKPLGEHCPLAYKQFVERGRYVVLRAPRTKTWRTPSEQGPVTTADASMLQTIYEHFDGRPHDFEACAIELWRMMASGSVSSVEGTQRSRDGGRDGVGLYTLGPKSDPIHLDFSLEAKCYSPTTFSGVKDSSRLISRLRHRQFGVFVTTSGLNQQAYKELREDGHPVVVICGRDIVEILRQHGFSDESDVQAWLDAEFPSEAAIQTATLRL